MPRADYILGSGDFSSKLSKGDQQWRKTQVHRVLYSFDEARAVMSRHSIRILYKYLRAGDWIDDSTIPSAHPAYKSIVGRKRHEYYHYYPYFFVLQAIYPATCGVKKVCESFSRFWGVHVDPIERFYPRLENPRREYALIRGRHPRDDSVGKAASPATPTITKQSSMVPAQSSTVSAQQSSSQQATNRANIDQPETSKNNNAPNNYEEQLTRIRTDFERRLSEFQNQVLKDAAGSREESERRLRGVQEKAKEIRDHAAEAEAHACRADDHASEAQEHSRTAIKLADALIESLSKTAERPVILVPDGKRPKKRVRES